MWIFYVWSVLLKYFIALDCYECEGKFYEEVELCYRQSKGKLQIDHTLSYDFGICMIYLKFTTVHVLLKSFAKHYAS